MYLYGFLTMVQYLYAISREHNIKNVAGANLGGLNEH